MGKYADAIRERLGLQPNRRANEIRARMGLRPLPPPDAEGGRSVNATTPEWLTAGALADLLDTSLDAVHSLLRTARVPRRKGATKADTLYSVPHVRRAILAPVDATPRGPEVIYRPRGMR